MVIYDPQEFFSGHSLEFPDGLVWLVRAGRRRRFKFNSIAPRRPPPTQDVNQLGRIVGSGYSDGTEIGIPIDQ